MRWLLRGFQTGRGGLVAGVFESSGVDHPSATHARERRRGPLPGPGGPGRTGHRASRTANRMHWGPSQAQPRRIHPQARANKHIRPLPARLGRTLGVRPSIARFARRAAGRLSAHRSSASLPNREHACKAPTSTGLSPYKLPASASHDQPSLPQSDREHAHLGASLPTSGGRRPSGGVDCGSTQAIHTCTPCPPDRLQPPDSQQDSANNRASRASQTVPANRLANRVEHFPRRPI